MLPLAGPLPLSFAEIGDWYDAGEENEEDEDEEEGVTLRQLSMLAGLSRLL